MILNERITILSIKKQLFSSYSPSKGEYRLLIEPRDVRLFQELSKRYRPVFFTYAPDEKLKSSVDSCLQDNLISARGLALITGQIISISCASG